MKKNDSDKNLISFVCKKINENYDSIYSKSVNQNIYANEVEIITSELYKDITETRNFNGSESSNESDLNSTQCRLFNPYERYERSGQPIPQEALAGTSPTGGFNNSVLIHSGEFYSAEKTLKSIVGLTLD